jgi:ABC-type multidrug transport system fused ATPase/permease subunit
MFTFDQTRKDIILEWVERFFKFERAITIPDIDFDRHWSHVFFLQKKYLSALILQQLQYSIVITGFPLFLAYGVAQNRFDLIIAFLSSFVVMRVVTHWLFRYHPPYMLNSSESVLIKSYEKLMLVDPEHHSTRSSGQIISKISRGSQSILAIEEIFIFDLIPFFFALVTVVIALSLVSATVTVILLVAFVILILFNYIGFALRSQIHSPERQKAQDRSTAANVESMQQVQYIRSANITQDQLDTMKQLGKCHMVNRAGGWRWAGWFMATTQIMFYLVAIGVVIVLWRLDLQSALLLGIMYSIISLGSALFSAGRSLDKLIHSLDDLNDLWNFINNFGEQTYPVIEEDRKHFN